jgi:hypothetical protein
VVNICRGQELMNQERGITGELLAQTGRSRTEQAGATSKVTASPTNLLLFTSTRLRQTNALYEGPAFTQTFNDSVSRWVRRVDRVLS